MKELNKYTADEYLKALTEFHGNFAPGLFIGGFMVAAAIRRMTEYEFFDAICESTACLPDAIQMLTPCTVGNGWLKIINTGRFAITLYEKKSGDGVRVSLDAQKLDRFPEIKNWFLRLSRKQEQDQERLIREIQTAGEDVFFIRRVTVSPKLRGKHAHGRVVICASCNEAYPEEDGELCRACQGMEIYSELSRVG
ncbi:MAG: formylmethanofuran dehydrogenase subunit E family protein [Spirochaetes bacterium]|nr:formylmethanofuran dehydrogenase subunit E family protein [Spirochaetota bacterium]